MKMTEKSSNFIAELQELQKQKEQFSIVGPSGNIQLFI